MANMGFSISRFMCTNCGRETIPLPRKSNQRRPWAHLKKMYCPFCGGEYNAFEVVRDYDKEVFYEMYNEGFFKEDCLEMEKISKRKEEILREIRQKRSK